MRWHLNQALKDEVEKDSLGWSMGQGGLGSRRLGGEWVWNGKKCHNLWLEMWLGMWVGFGWYAKAFGLHLYPGEFHDHISILERSECWRERFWTTTKKSGGQKNGPETVIIGQVVSDEVLCQGGMNLREIFQKKENPHKNLAVNEIWEVTGRGPWTKDSAIWLDQWDPGDPDLFYTNRHWKAVLTKDEWTPAGPHLDNQKDPINKTHKWKNS